MSHVLPFDFVLSHRQEAQGSKASDRLPDVTRTTSRQLRRMGPVNGVKGPYDTHGPG